MSERTQSLGGEADNADHCVARAQVVVVDGPDRGATVEADGAEIAIGTSQGNDLVLTDPTVSRHHVSIELAETGARLRDLSSTNGTRFGGRRVTEIWLQPGDQFQLGRTIIELGEPNGLIREPVSAETAWGDVLGTSRAMRKLFAALPAVAASESTVLLSGETGCGKSLIAHAIHAGSDRREAPFIVVDCGAIPASLIESELFGHEKGAFTGADSARVGAFRSASGGTLLLEEIGELPIEMQPRLLRALEERVVSPVGSDVDHPIDIRVIAATNRDLRERVNSGHFRADLFYRLNVLPIRVPPLRERREDIPILVRHFHLELTGDEPPLALVDALVGRDWPGNVRELRAALERAIVFGELAEETAPAAAFDPTLSFRAAKEAAIANWERDYLGELIESYQGNISAAARAVRMDRNHLRELLIRRGVDYKKRD